MEKKKIEKNNWSFWVCCFIVYCMIGWIYEVIWEFAVGNGFVNRGFLYGPYLPIYGFGVLILLFMLGSLLKKDIKIGKANLKPLIVFTAILIIVSIIEYVASLGMEIIFNKRWWDYSYDKFNINGRISLRNSTLLAIGGFVLIYFVQPFLYRIIGKIDIKKRKISAILIISIMSIDFIITLLGYFI